MSNAFSGQKMLRAGGKKARRIVFEFNFAHGFARGYALRASDLARRLGGGGSPGPSAALHLIKMHKLRKAYAIEMSKRYIQTIRHQQRLAFSPIN